MTYAMGIPPDFDNPDIQRLVDYIKQELDGIQQDLGGSNQLELRTAHAEPEKPREGMIVHADGTDWNPGEGVGIYKYEGGAWVRLADGEHTHVLADITDAGDLAAQDTITLSQIDAATADRVIGTDGSGVIGVRTITQILNLLGGAARGDIIRREASDWNNFPIGAAGTVLKSDGTDPSWGTAAWLVELATASSGGATLEFTDISSIYRTLVVKFDRVSTSANVSVIPQFSESSSFSPVLTLSAVGIRVDTGASVSGLAVESTAPGLLTLNSGGEFSGYLY